MATDFLIVPRSPGFCALNSTLIKVALWGSARGSHSAAVKEVSKQWHMIS